MLDALIYFLLYPPEQNMKYIQIHILGNFVISYFKEFVLNID